MTCIIWTDTGIFWDRKVSWWINWTQYKTKIFRVWDNLIWLSGYVVEIPLLIEFYDKFIKENPEWLTTLIWCLSFYNIVKDSIDLPDDQSIALMIINPKQKITIQGNWQLEVMWEEWYLFIWSGWYPACNAIKTFKQMKVKPEMEDVFEIVSAIDSGTSKEFDSLIL